VREAPSPNHDERPTDTPIDMLVLHYTGMRTGQEAIDRLRDPDAAIRVSSHYVVEEDGQVWRLVPEERRAWHAGVSFWRGHHQVNGRCIGIEIVNPGHEWGYRPFPHAQMEAARDLCQGILARHPIPARNVVGHSDIAPDRKEDPGELFDWPFLARHGVGLWPEARATPVPLADVAATLAAIGYPIPDLATTVRAFQRRWRPSLLTGEPDEATRERMTAVEAAYEGQ
jgi:N-acetylmuramoyl-L-alanine amidase